MQRSILIFVFVVNTHSCIYKKLTILIFVNFNSNVQRSFSKISQRVDVDARMINQSGKNQNCWVHCGVVYWTPIRLKFVIYVDRNLILFLIQVREKIGRIISTDGLQKLLMHFFHFFPIIFPHWFWFNSRFLFVKAAKCNFIGGIIF